MTETEIEQLRIDTHGFARTLVELATLLNSSEFRRQYSSGLASRDGTLKPIVATESAR